MNFKYGKTLLAHQTIINYIYKQLQTIINAHYKKHKLNDTLNQFQDLVSINHAIAKIENNTLKILTNEPTKIENNYIK